MTTTLDRGPAEPGPAQPGPAEPGPAEPGPAGRRPDEGRWPAYPRSGTTVMPAGRALQVMLVALLFAGVFNSAALVRAGEGMEPGLTRSLVLAVGRPVHAVTHALWLDRPRVLLGAALGTNRTGSGNSPLLRPAEERAAAGSGNTPDTSGAGQPAPATAGQQDGPSGLATRTPTPAAPLRLLVTGDSMTEFLGPALLAATSGGGLVRGRAVTRYGTGLVRPDFFDWSAEAKRLLAAHSPEAVVVAMGGNDGQGIRLPGGTVLPDGSPEWASEYQRRAGIVMRALTAAGARRVYWVSMPVARSARLARDYAQLNRAVSAAATAVPGVRSVDITGRLSADGRYAAYLPNDAGRTVLARARDGIHLTRDGARIATTVIARVLREDWHLANP